MRFLAILLLCFLPAAVLPARPPDIVVFLTDDQSQRDASPYGARGMDTPNMQKLADAGMTFERACVASPSCAPSRAALLTGLMPSRNGAEANHSRPAAQLRKWPSWFHELGYETAAFGKVSHYQHTGDYGFQIFGNDGFHDHAGIAKAVGFLAERDRSRPLCLMVGTNWPHVPWPEQHGLDPGALPLPAGSIDTPETREWRARYAAAVARADDHLGIIRKAAAEHLSSDTVFVYSADHGAQWPFAKWNLYEAGIAVPLIIAWPGKVAAGSRTMAMVQWTDLLPTLLAAAGGRAPDDIDGKSFLPVLLGKSASHRDRVFATHSGDGRMNVYPARSLRRGDWKYIRNLHPEYAFTTHIDLVSGRLGQRSFFASWEAAARTDPEAAAILRRYHERPAEELYDLASDPHELRNLATQPEHAGMLRSLAGELSQWMQEQQDRGMAFAKPRLLSEPDSYGPRAVQPEKPKPVRPRENN
jgi:N-sulfoglucosamine sulfohydrolase